MASWPRLIVVCSVLLVGCSADSTSATSAEPTLPGSPALPMHTTEATTAETQSGTTQQEPPPTATTSSTTTATEAVTTTTEPTSEVTEAAVNAVLVEYLPAALADTNFGGKAFCGHYLHGFEQNGDDVSAYISGWCHEYYVAQGLMEMGTGHGVHARVDLKVGDAGISAYGFEQAGDGEGEPEIFPQWVLDAMRTQRTVIVPDQPLTQAADYFAARPQRSLPSGATCAADQRAVPAVRVRGDVLAAGGETCRTRLGQRWPAVRGRVRSPPGGMVLGAAAIPAEVRALLSRHRCTWLEPR